jgi:hypothetical protein
MYLLSFMWQVLASPLPKALDPLGRTNERAFSKVQRAQCQQRSKPRHKTASRHFMPLW